MTTNYRITGNTQAPPLYPLNSTTIPTVSNVTIASNLATATAAAGSFVTWDYEASNTVTKITPKFTMQLSGLTIDPTSATGSIKINYPDSDTLQVGSKILVTDGGATTEETIAAGSQATIPAPTIAPSTIERAILKLANGKLLITGGGIANTYAYDPSTGTLETLANNPEGATSWYYNSCAAVGNKAYFWGNQSYSNTLRIYDYDTDSWDTGTSYFTGLCFATCLALENNTIMIMGGKIGINIDTNECRIYNPETNSYTTIANLPAISDAGVAVQIDSDTVIMLRGRRDGNITTNDVYQYKISTNLWSSLANSPFSKVPGQFFYLISSDIARIVTNNTADGNDYYDYNISGNLWSGATALTTPSGGYVFGAVQADNEIWYTINLDTKIRTISFTTDSVSELPSYYQFTITSPSLPVPDAVYLGGQTLGYSVQETTTPSWQTTTLTYEDSAGTITATAAQYDVTGTHVVLRVQNLNSGDVVSMVGADLTIASPPPPTPTGGGIPTQIRGNRTPANFITDYVVFGKLNS